MSPDRRDANEVLIATAIIAALGFFALVVLEAAGMYEPLQAAPAPEPTTFTACPDCHIERQPNNGCGKLKGREWAACVHRDFEGRAQDRREQK